MLMTLSPAIGVLKVPATGAVLSMLMAKKPEAMSVFLTVSRTTTEKALAPSRGMLLFSGSRSLNENCI